MLEVVEGSLVESLCWNNVQEHMVIPGFRARFIHSDRVTLVRWRLDAGAKLPEHSHQHEQVVLVDDGELELVVDGARLLLKAGDVLVIPPTAVHSGTALTALRLMDVFCPVREDYRGSFGRTILSDALTHG